RPFSFPQRIQILFQYFSRTVCAGKIQAAKRPHIYQALPAGSATAAHYQYLEPLFVGFLHPLIWCYYYLRPENRLSATLIIEHMKRILQYTRGIAALLMLGLFVAGCNNDDDGGGGGGTPSTPSSFKVAYNLEITQGLNAGRSEEHTSELQ